MNFFLTPDLLSGGGDHELWSNEDERVASDRSRDAGDEWSSIDLTY